MHVSILHARGASDPAGSRASSLLTLFASLLCAPALWAEPAPTELHVALHGSRHLRTGVPIARVSVGSAEVADVAAFPPDQLLITGKKVGQTTATVWSKTDEVTVYTIFVDYAVDTMTRALAAAIPEGKDLRVTSAGTTLVVSGRVPDAAHVEHAEAVVRGFYGAGEGGDQAPLMNLITVEGDYQVQLEVSFAEISRTALKEIGLNFWQKAQSGDYAAGILNPSSAQTGLSPNYGQEPGASALSPTMGLPVIATPLAGTFGMVFATALDGAFPFAAALSVLSNNGYARTLSEPTLVAMSGQQATFLAGGEFPVPLPQSLGQVGVEYKKFGVQLAFVPTVVHDTIQLQMSTTVSDIDFGLGIRLAQVTVPGLTERHAQTHVRLRDGQSFAIAGLLSDRVRSSVAKVPWLGDLPILGALFRSTSYRREETELLVVVTARIVRPRDQRPPLPGQDTVSDPSDLELFFLGTAESKPTAEAPKRPAQPVGPVGFQR